MISVIGFFYFLFGTIIGSFLNVVIVRHNTGTTITGSSRCATCARELRYFELIPIISYILLRGRCRICGSHISLQYPIVELLTGLLFLGIFFMGTARLEEIFLMIVMSLLIVIFFYDIKHKIIPNILVYTFITLSFLHLFVDLSTFSFLIPPPVDIFAGPILFVPFFLLWFLSSGKWMGLGDGKLVLGIGFMLGLAKGITAVIVGFWIGAIASVLLLVLTKVLQYKRLFNFGARYTMKSEVPFAPFLIIGFLAVLFFDIDILLWNIDILDFLN